MRNQPARAFTAVVALATLATAVAGLPGPVAGTTQAIAETPAGLPDGCAPTNATAYACSFAGETEARPVPANPVVRPEPSAVATFTLPLPARALVWARATAGDGDGLTIALDAGHGPFVTTDAGSTIRHAIVGAEARDLDILVARTGGAGGAWRVDVTVEGAPAIAATRDLAVSVPAPPAERRLPASATVCEQGYCVAGTDPARRATDAAVGLALSKGVLALNVTRQGGQGDVDVALLDAIGATRATATMAPGSTAAFGASVQDGFGTWYVRVGTDVTDPGGFRAEGTFAAERVVEPAPTSPTAPTPSTNASATTDPLASASRDDGHAEESRGLAEWAPAIGFYGSAAAVGLVGVAIVAVATKKW